MMGKLGSIATIVAAVISCLWFYVQLKQWQLHGDDFMFLVGSVIVTLLLWATLGIAVWRFNAQRTESKKKLKEDTAAAAKYAMLWMLAEWANTLAGRLEEIWHSWDNREKNSSILLPSTHSRQD
jgi:hypothetical protein